MLEILYILGVFCAFSILEHTLQTVIVYQKLMPFPWCNDICEMMIFALPVPFYYARRRFVHFFVPFAFYAAMLPAMSMTAVLVGAVILALGLVYTFVYNPQKRAWVYAAFAFALCAAVFVVIHYRLYSIEAIKTLFASQENGRLDLFRSAWENFKLHPILGVGIGYGTNDGSFMKSFWTHNWLLQILGSLGVVGMLAYGYQMLVRAKLIFKRRTAFRMMVGLSYLGIFLASMLQPGEFCPMPYELLAVALFALLEMTENDTAPCIGGEL